MKQIFGQDRRYVIPLFQRPYVWEREKQWTPFWDDIRRLADRILQNKQPRPHFLGAIVLDQVMQQTGKVEARLVIDGQQRLTTLQIFLEAFCDLCCDRGKDKHHRALLKLTRNDDPMSEDAEEEFKVWPTNVDQEHFERVMHCKSPVELRKQYDVKPNSEVGHPIADAYLFFFESIDEWLKACPESEETRLEALFDAARECIRLVVIDLEKEDDAQSIFETLNARGTPLLPTDLVKNYLFHEAELGGNQLGPLYCKYWQMFDDEPQYWRRKAGRGHAQRYRIDNFLQHFLTLKLRDEIQVDHLYVAFREYAYQSGSAIDVLAAIKTYAEVYREFDNHERSSRVGQFFERLTAMGITSAHPFLLELFATYGDDKKVVTTVLDDLESFLVRRMICQLNTRGYNRLFLDLLKHFGDAQESPVDSVRAFLLSSEVDSNRWPNDDEFRDAWMTQPLYRSLVRRRVRMLLEALERKLRTSKTEQMELQEKLTVEHLMPQHWQKHWPLPEETDELVEQRKRLVHSLGNLTLVTRALNPAVSNGPWLKKQPQILKHSLLRLNHALSEFAEWDEEGIHERGLQLFKLAKRVWPYPGQ